MDKFLDTVQRALAFSSVILRSPIYPASTLRYLSPSPGVDSFSQFFSPRTGILHEYKESQILETRTDRNIVAVTRFGENGTRGDDFRGETRNKQTNGEFLPDE